MVDLILWLSANVGDRADVAKNRNKEHPVNRKLWLVKR